MIYGVHLSDTNCRIWYIKLQMKILYQKNTSGVEMYFFDFKSVLFSFPLRFAIAILALK